LCFRTPNEIVFVIKSPIALASWIREPF
jgi:hypothetical protein